jgi:hypothetical protein
MNEVSPVAKVDDARALIREHPERMRQEQAAADAMIGAAAALGRWDELELAVDLKIAQQQEFVAVWDAKVRSQGDARKKSPPEGFLSVPALQRQTGVSQQQASRWRMHTAPERIDDYRERIIDAARLAAELKAKANHRAQGTGESEWFTPRVWVERAREVLGDIDLDPASHALAQQTIHAKTFFTVADNGLEQPWFGRVWLNPPYCREFLSPFVDKLVAEWTRGAIEQAILLTHNYTDAGWFHAAARASRAFCFTCGRIRFLSPAGYECKPTQGQVFFYFGPNDAAFRRTFADVCLIAREDAPAAPGERRDAHHERDDRAGAASPALMEKPRRRAGTARQFPEKGKGP